MTISQAQICAYKELLISENKADSSIKEHLRYVNRFVKFVANQPLSQELLNEYRQYIDGRYTTFNGKNGCISYINSFLRFIGEDELVMPYFEVERTALRLRTLPLSDEDIENLLNFVNNKTKGSDFDESYFKK